jgi:predicted AAA+ superfamily ATPase
VGKSFLLREILAKKSDYKYLTFDNASILEQFTKMPHLFLENYKEYKTLIVYEPQKSPKIFDSLKEVVDKNRVPGKFILSGSTEFSLLTHIRESLTGRPTRVQLFPFLLSEIKHLPLNATKNLSLFNKSSQFNWLLNK